ncbi:MAG: putative membrane protein, partial [Colwellia sp.]
RVIDSKDMPFMNKTKITDEERLTLSLWLNQIK